MFLRFIRLGSAFLLALLIIARFPAHSNQQASPRSVQSDNQQLPARISDQTYRVSVDLVNIFCSVWDKDTKSFVTNLTRDDFTVYEDGKKQQINNFIRETDLPLTLAMLIDTSQSVAPKLEFEQEAAIRFFQSIMREQDRAMIAEFNSGVTLVQDFTNDPNKLARQINKLRAAGGTSLYDAIYLACDEKLIRETGRKAIIVLSDGEDQSSRKDFEEALEMAIRAETIIFSISVSKGGFFGVESSDEGNETLEKLAEETGGRVFFPFKIDELADAFRQVNQELRSQYNIGYLSNNTARDGSYRKIEIKISEGGKKLNFRKGYYAPSS